MPTKCNVMPTLLLGLRNKKRSLFLNTFVVLIHEFFKSLKTYLPLDLGKDTDAKKLLSSLKVPTLLS